VPTPKQKLSLEVRDVTEVLENKISPSRYGSLASIPDAAPLLPPIRSKRARLLATLNLVVTSVSDAIGLATGSAPVYHATPLSQIILYS
jgi:hypothetical protein